MPACILHVGMPKSGTSSIQASLYFGLEDPRFRLVNLGHENGSLFVEPIFRDDPGSFWLHGAKGLSPARLGRMRAGLEARLRRALRRARDASAAAIISAETLWGHSPEELARLRDFLLREGFEPRVIAYIRPHRSYVESGFQQAMRFDHDGFRPARRAGESWKLPLPDAAERLGRFEATFGRDRLTVRPFRGGSLVGGCAVRDFRQTLGIDLAAASIIRSNESLSADAVRLLYCYNRFARRDRPPSFHASLVLLDSLKDLPGRPFRLHPDVTAPISEAIDRHDREVFDRFGVDLREGPRTEDGSAVRDETDLFRLAPESLEWLARNSGLGPIAPGDGEAVARAVAGRVAALARGPSLYARIDRLRRAARRSVRWLRRGD